LMLKDSGKILGYTVNIKEIFIYLWFSFFLVARFAREVIQPRVQAMDEAEVMDKDIITAMFDNGVCI
jgi:hypothetical protein